MSEITVQAKAYAKLNLSLDVLARRADGYHDLCMVMQRVSLADDLTLCFQQPAHADASRPVCVSSNLHYLPTGEHNLAAGAALRLCESVGLDADALALSIRIQKRIPVCAGLGGGSSDAAAVLHALNQALALGLSPERLAEIGQRVGSDVPYCVLGGTALAEGRGERLTPLPALPHCWVVLCKPAFSIQTPELFERIRCTRIQCRPDTAGILSALRAGDLSGVARRMYNVFEDVLPARRADVIASIKNELIQSGALGASMSGTGPTVFGIFSAEPDARAAFDTLRASYRDTFIAQTL